MSFSCRRVRDDHTYPTPPPLGAAFLWEGKGLSTPMTSVTTGSQSPRNSSVAARTEGSETGEGTQPRVSGRNAQRDSAVRADREERKGRSQRPCRTPRASAEQDELPLPRLDAFRCPLPPPMRLAAAARPLSPVLKLPRPRGPTPPLPKDCAPYPARIWPGGVGRWSLGKNA